MTQLPSNLGSMTLDDLARTYHLSISSGSNHVSNWHANQISARGHRMWFRAGGHVRLREPDSLAQVAAAARHCVYLCAWARRHGWRARACGQLWSFSDVMVPGRKRKDKRSLLIDTRSFQHVEKTSDPHLWYATSGSNIAFLNDYFEKRGLSLITSGSSNGQTIAGAVGTGVHGSAVRFGALHDAVRAFHVATTTEHILVGRDDGHPQAVPTAVRNTLATELGVDRIVADSALFDALAVSFGSLGIVVGVVLEVEPRYALWVLRRSFPAARLGALVDALVQDTPLAQVDPALAPQDPADELHHVQLLVNPYERTTYKIVAMYKRPGHDPGAAFVWPDGFDAIGVEFLKLAGRLIGLADALFDDRLATEFDNLADVSQWGFRSQVFGFPLQPLAVHSVGIGVPIASVERLLDIAHSVVQRERFPGAGELRFVRASPAYLAINRFAPITAVLGFDGVDIRDSWESSRLLFRELRASGIDFSVHWGKMTDLGPGPKANRRKLDAMYGPALDSWLHQRDQLLGDDAKVFDNAFLRRAGLSVDDD